MTTDESFGAEGPAVVAFETVGLTPADVPAIGVAVYAHQCGVNGVALSDIPANAHLTAPNLVGVHGFGESEGVQGEGFIGVHGLVKVVGPPALGGSGTGVLGEGGQFGVHGKGDIGVMGEGGVTGVVGKSNTGVRGDGLTVGVEGQSPKTGVMGSGGAAGVVGNGGAIGVEGIGEAIGVHGYCKRNRAGIFHTGPTQLPALDRFASDPSPQVLLIPHNTPGTVEASLPRAGLAGDLFAAVPPLRGDVQPVAELWFCLRDGSADAAGPGAVWAKVQFSTTFTVP